MSKVIRRPKPMNITPEMEALNKLAADIQQRGIFQCMGIPGHFMGLKAERIIVDDALKDAPNKGKTVLFNGTPIETDVEYPITDQIEEIRVVEKLPMFNVYRCEFNCLTTTVDCDHGVTPFMIQCRRRSTPERPIAAMYLDEEGYCKGIAQSNFYPKVPKPAHIPDPSWEWVIPDAAEREANPDQNDHFDRGGLYLRPRSNREPVYHE